MTELKPCPCCGAEAHIDREDIFCDCGLNIKIEPFYYEQPIALSMDERWRRARVDAVEAWNRRVKE